MFENRLPEASGAQNTNSSKSIPGTCNINQAKMQFEDAKLHLADTNPLHWLANMDSHAPKLLVTDEFGPEFCSLPKENQRNYDKLPATEIQYDMSLPNVMISCLQKKDMTSHTIPLIFNINPAKMQFDDAKPVLV